MASGAHTCDGMCLTGADVGVPEFTGVAYAHPGCLVHGGGQPCKCGLGMRCTSYTHESWWREANGYPPELEEWEV